MAKIAIDLLPAEFRVSQLKQAKFYKIQAVGVTIILMMIFLASATVVLRILQNRHIVQIQNNLAQAEEKVSSLKGTQGSLVLLQNRLATIDKYLDTPSEGVLLYKLLSNILPDNVTINSISIAKGGEVVVLATAADGNSLDELVTNLTSSDKNQGKINQVSIDNIGRGRDGVYRVNFKIKP